MDATQLDDIFGTDDDKEKNGVWCEHRTGTGAIKVKIGHAGPSNTRFAAALEAGTRPFRRAIEHDQVGDENYRMILQRAFAETIVLDWDLKNKDTGVAIPCKPDAVMAVFKRFPQFWVWVQREARTLANFQTATLEAVAKN